jgi:hypothetical protein
VGILDVGNEDTDHLRALATTEVACETARPIVELGDRVQHTLLPWIRDSGRAVQNARYGRDRDTGTLSDVADPDVMKSIPGIDFTTINGAGAAVKPVGSSMREGPVVK